MAYSDFTLENVVDQFGIILESGILFDSIQPLEPTSWLKETFIRGEKTALASSTEKARSEFLVAPILLEIQSQTTSMISIYSGKTLTADTQRGLNGECDFMLGIGPTLPIIQSPIFSLVEAKRQDLQLGIGQCAAQMLGAQIFNQNHDRHIPIIYGCVTTGEAWQFLRLQDRHLKIESRMFYLNELEKILGIFQMMIMESLEPES
jgi:hypothetical protein